MAQPRVDGVLVEWGSRLFYPMPKKGREARGSGLMIGAAASALLSAGAVRAKVRETIAPGARQVMVKITGGGKGMKAIAAHFRYMSRLGKEEVGGKGQSLELEDERGEKIFGVDDIKSLREEWQFAGSYIPDESDRREAFNVMLSMPAGTPPSIVRDAARDFANETFAGHKYLFALHEDTDSPHVHLVVRAERLDGVRLNPRKADLRAWRQRFADRLQERGISAAASRASTRGVEKAPQELWRLKMQELGKLNKPRPTQRGMGSQAARAAALQAWRHVAAALDGSDDAGDKALAAEVKAYVSRQFEGIKQVRSSRARQERGPEPGR